MIECNVYDKCNVCGRCIVYDRCDVYDTCNKCNDMINRLSNINVYNLC